MPTISQLSLGTLREVQLIRRKHLSDIEEQSLMHLFERPDKFSLENNHDRLSQSLGFTQSFAKALDPVAELEQDIRRQLAVYTFLENQDQFAKSSLLQPNRDTILAGRKLKKESIRLAKATSAYFEYVQTGNYQSSYENEYIQSLISIEEIAKSFNEGLIEFFEDLGSDLDEIEQLANDYTNIKDWKIYRCSQAAILATPALLGPISLGALPLELLALMRLTYNSALGVGYIRYGTASIIDFENIFYLMATNTKFSNELVSELGVKAAALGGQAAIANGGAKIGFKLVASAISKKFAIKAAGAVSPIAVQKMSTWLAKILAGPSVGRVIPLIGAVVGGSVNAYITNSFIDAAVRYYDGIDKVIKKI